MTELIPNSNGHTFRTNINNALQNVNVAEGFVQLDSEGKMPPVDSSQLTNVPPSILLWKSSTIIEATQGSWYNDVLPDDTTLRNNFITVSDGTCKIIIDSVEHDVTGLDFTTIGYPSAYHISQVIQNSVADITGDSASNGSNTSIYFKSNTYGSTSSVDIQPSGLSGTDITGINYLNISNSGTSIGQDESGEPADPFPNPSITPMIYDYINKKILYYDGNDWVE
jgi:hypothetical protein